MNSFQQRFLAAAVMAPLFLAALYFGGFVFNALIIALCFIGFKEWWALPKTLPVKLLGIVYLGLPAFCLIWLRQLGIAPTLMIILAVWLTDTGAYFTGRHFGGPKLAPSISPNKTWSGLAGGMAASGVTVVLLAWFFHLPHWPAYFALGAAVAFVAQMGDLFESHMKRRAGVKDSGRLIPGHGGILDRIDGLLTAVPFFAVFTWLLL